MNKRGLGVVIIAILALLVIGVISGNIGLFDYDVRLSPLNFQKGASFGSGTGTSEIREQPDTRAIIEMEVCTRNDIDLIVRNNLNGNYIQVCDIDFSGWAEFEPIGDRDNPFTGKFKGNGKRMFGLEYIYPARNYVGLFGVTRGARIENVRLEDWNVEGLFYVGGLIGWAEKTSVLSVEVNGIVGNSGGHYTGGIVGYINNGKLIGSNFNGLVRGFANSGGLIGYSNGTLRDSYFEGNFEGNRNGGGLVGQGVGEIENSYFDGEISVKTTPLGGSQVGGLVGRFNGNISDSYAIGEINSDGEVAGIGGIVGKLEYRGPPEGRTLVFITNSYAEMNISAVQLISSGGFIGAAAGANIIISDSYSSGSLDAERGGTVGGFVGTIVTGGEVEIVDSFSVGDVNIPCLDGECYGSFGGFAGYLASYSDRGLLVDSSYSEGDVITGSYGVGGFVGTADNKVVINQSYSTGNVEGEGDFGRGGIGGFVGNIFGSPASISNSYSTGDVTDIAGVVSRVGGFGGYFSNVNVENSYSNGLVEGSSFVGGLIGNNDGTIEVINSYWDIETSNQTMSAGGEGRTTLDMTEVPWNETYVYVDWNLLEIWSHEIDGEYPVLSWEV